VSEAIRTGAQHDAPPLQPDLADEPSNRIDRPRRRKASERSLARLERDIERGYSINAKQVILAFAVEFFIIGLILVGQYLVAEEAAKDKVFAILLFPIALAVVELARVPLAVAVRTQDSWSVKFFAALGVIAAVIVTSFSLSMIAYQTFDPRLAEATEKKNLVLKLSADREIVVSEIEAAKENVEQRVRARDDINARYQELQKQISQIPTAIRDRCTITTNPDGSTTRNCAPQSTINTSQLKTLQTELANTKKQLDDSEIALKEANSVRTKLDLRPVEERLAHAQNDYRVAVARSQLHSYTSMIRQKPPSEVTDAEVKALESYLIFIPSIAAALASTLLAISAVRRIRRRRPDPPVTIPDEAARYLFGPMLEAIRKEASNAVAAAMSKKDSAADTERPVLRPAFAKSS
jgi:hypothetical protein